MSRKAILVLEDGSVYEGHSFGADVQGCGEVVFNTAMTGYQEVLTDPSYAGQMVVLTYPLIGNYGINPDDFESKRVQVSGFIVREECRQPSHWQSTSTLSDFLAEAGVPGIGGVDTRALTRRLRSAGVMMGIITADLTPEEALRQLKAMPPYGETDFLKKVTAEAPYHWEPPAGSEPRFKCHTVCIDCGLKFSTLRIMRNLGCNVTVVPCTTSAGEVLKLDPDSVFLTSGPGNPEVLDYMVETVRGLIGKKPIMAICLGHQLIGRAFGARTFKLKFGHHGGNHPVRDLETGRVAITTQNHGYAIDPETLPSELQVNQVNLNDGTVEGLRHRELPILSIQYHSEAAPGPRDSMHLFKEFVDMLRAK